MPRKICYIDAFSGVSGDMLVGALADAGASQETIIRALDSMRLEATYSFEPVKRRGISATKFHVHGTEAPKHRHLGPILTMIDAAGIPDRAKQNAAAVFRRLGEAEAAVHQQPIEKVHFHEVGAVDSIADIVGACLGFELLGADEVVSSPLNLGSGTVQTEHGLLPVPAPATARLVQGKPVYSRGPAVELTTPTGAAVVTTLAASFGVLPPLTLLATGAGAGSKDFETHANILRIMVGHASHAAEATEIAILEANLDDLSPQVLAYTVERLLAAGALDATLQPIAMKKGRPGTMLRVLAAPEDRERLAALIFAETTTLGLRILSAERRVQARSFVEVSTRHGAVRIKVSGGGSYAPEYEDCRKLALEKGVPLKEIIAEACFAYLSSASPHSTPPKNR
ncbi:MAG: nickel pincer cofactor biosynthesis protein LarC [Bryobacteraceae bacterium]